MMNKTVFKQICIFFLVITACFFSGCYPGVREKTISLNSLEKLNRRNYPQFSDDMDSGELMASIDNSLSYFRKVPLERKYRYGDEIYTAGHMITSLGTFKSFLEKKPSTKDLNAFIRSLFFVYKARGNDDEEVLFTGYFEPGYEGSQTRSLEYPYPVYSKPDDLLEIDLSSFSDKYKGYGRLAARVEEKKVVPYYSREQINSARDFHVKSEPVVWLKSRIDRFFLEIQGSGRIKLDTGEVVRVHYGASNGKAYSSIGRYLIKENEISKENMSMQAIREWLELHPKRMDEVLHQNESFVFFRKEDGGPYGSLGVEVTPFRSIATDKTIFPKGALCFIQAQVPDRANINPLKKWGKTSFFAMNQDTGGAIKGMARADIFCGNGPYAEFTAGHMNKYGKLFFLVLKPFNIR